jgi:hypothetical protein
LSLSEFTATINKRLSILALDGAMIQLASGKGHWLVGVAGGLTQAGDSVCLIIICLSIGYKKEGVRLALPLSL